MKKKSSSMFLYHRKIQLLMILSEPEGPSMSLDMYLHMTTNPGFSVHFIYEQVFHLCNKCHYNHLSCHTMQLDGIRYGKLARSQLSSSKHGLMTVYCMPLSLNKFLSSYVYLILFCFCLSSMFRTTISSPNTVRSFPFHSSDIALN